MLYELNGYLNLSENITKESGIMISKHGNCNIPDSPEMKKIEITYRNIAIPILSIAISNSLRNTLFEFAIIWRYPYHDTIVVRRQKFTLRVVFVQLQLQLKTHIEGHFSQEIVVY